MDTYSRRLEREKSREQSRKAREHHTRETGHYFFIKAIVDGRLFIDGPFPTYDTAMQIGFKAIQTNFEVFESDTRDRKVATSRAKHNLLESTSDIRRATRYSKHKL